MNVEIAPYIVVREPLVFVRVIVTVVSINLGTSADIRVDYLTSDNTCLETKFLTLSGDDYLHWGSDDEYVVDWSLSQLGLVKA